MQERNAPFWLGPADAETACLLIHGFMGTPLEMHGLGQYLAERQMRVYGMVVAGHEGDGNHLVATGRKQWLASVEEALAELAVYRRVMVVGLSMGGALALLLASRHPRRIAGVAALSSLTRMNAEGWQQLALGALPLARHFVKWFYPLRMLNFNDPKIQQSILAQARLRDPSASIDFSNPAEVAYVKSMGRIPVPAIDELVRLTREERRRLHEVRCPLLIVHSRKDQTVRPESAEELYRLASAASSRSLHWLEHSEHVITTGVEREQVYELVFSFIQALPNVQLEE